MHKSLIAQQTQDMKVTLLPEAVKHEYLLLQVGPTKINTTHFIMSNSGVMCEIVHGSGT